jgi:hypothetical protein
MYGYPFTRFLLPSHIVSGSYIQKKAERTKGSFFGNSAIPYPQSPVICRSFQEPFSPPYQRWLGFSEEIFDKRLIDGTKRWSCQAKSKLSFLIIINISKGINKMN